jgi:hypothetical protein
MSFPYPDTPYLCPPETGWPSYTPRHWVPILVAFTTHMEYVGAILIYIAGTKSQVAQSK